jgi:hypothetical protein
VVCYNDFVTTYFCLEETFMAKKKTPGETSGRWERRSVSPQELESMAAIIDSFATQLRTSARDMRALRVDEVTLAIGNWDLACRKISTWVGNQLVPKVMEKAALSGGRLKLVEFEPAPSEDGKRPKK